MQVGTRLLSLCLVCAGGSCCSYPVLMVLAGLWSSSVRTTSSSVQVAGARTAA